MSEENIEYLAEDPMKRSSNEEIEMKDSVLKSEDGKNFTHAILEICI